MGSRKCLEAYLSRAGLGQLGVRSAQLFPCCAPWIWAKSDRLREGPSVQKVDGGSPRPCLAARPQCVITATAGSEWSSCMRGVGTSAGPALAFL